jgi:hypothetical protein
MRDAGADSPPMFIGHADGWGDGRGRYMWPLQGTCLSIMSNGAGGGG